MGKKLQHHILWLLLVLISVSFSCNKDDLAAKIPAYLYIPGFRLETDLSEQGSAHSNFTTAWVFYNNESVGAFELPCTIPIIPIDGEAELTVYPGVTMNGIGSTRSVYISCEPLEQNVTLTPLDTFAFNAETDSIPTTKYYDEATVIIVEDFEGNSINFEPTASSDTNIVFDTEDENLFNYPGEANKRSGLLAVGPDALVTEIQSSDSYTLPSGQDVYVEITYKSNNSFLVGIIANESYAITRSTLYINSSNNEWKKIYVNIIGEVGQSPQGTSFNLLMGAIKDDSVDDAKIYLDNIKLVYR